MILFARRGPVVLARRSQRPPLSARAGQRELRFTAAERKKNKKQKEPCKPHSNSKRERRAHSRVVATFITTVSSA